MSGHLLSHSNSFGFEMEIDTAGCRAYDRNYIVGGGTDGRKQDATADERTVGEEPGSGQGEKTDGVGAAHEQPESAGRGNDPDRADLQLNFLEAAICSRIESFGKENTLCSLGISCKP